LHFREEQLSRLVSSGPQVTTARQNRLALGSAFSSQALRRPKGPSCDPLDLLILRRTAQLCHAGRHAEGGRVPVRVSTHVRLGCVSVC
jgi:hypothetical protein